MLFRSPPQDPTRPVWWGGAYVLPSVIQFCTDNNCTVEQAYAPASYLGHYMTRHDNLPTPRHPISVHPVPILLHHSADRLSRGQLTRLRYLDDELLIGPDRQILDDYIPAPCPPAQATIHSFDLSRSEPLQEDPPFTQQPHLYGYCHFDSAHKCVYCLCKDDGPRLASGAPRYTCPLNPLYWPHHVLQGSVKCTTCHEHIPTVYVDQPCPANPKVGTLPH